MKFWDTVREVSAREIRDEANRPFRLALAGRPDRVAEARQRLLEGADSATAAAAEAFLLCASPPYPPEVEERLRSADLLVSLPGGPSLADYRPADTLLVEHPDRLVARVLAHRPDLALPLARRLPGFRQAAADRVIREVSRINAEFAALSGLSQSLPILAPLLPAVGGADIVVITKNQVLLVFRLAAIYGQDLGLRARVKEVLPVIGGGLGWRALARQLLGILPGGVGLPVRAAVAYVGTYAAGRAAEFLFRRGRRPTRAEMRRIYAEAREAARQTAARIRDRLRRSATAGEPERPATTSDAPPGERRSTRPGPDAGRDRGR